MSAKNDKETVATIDQTIHTQKFITCIQSTGRIGKSTFAEALLHWLEFAGVEYGAVDSDAQHRTLSERNAKTFFYNAVSDKNQFATFIETMPDKPVLLADFPAQVTDFVLDNWRAFNVNEIFASRASRLVNVIFAVDDETAIVSAIQIFEQFGTEHSDYIIVKNPARARSTNFEKIKLYTTLRDAGAREINLPVITVDTLTAVQDLSIKQERYVSLAEASNSPDVSLLRRFELQHFLNSTMAQLEDAADMLLPGVEAIKNKVVRPASETASARKVNPFKRY
jgi:adenosyl cobinamide kinase/adenosyl cobinamide phosphate guanylyltransferase